MKKGKVIVIISLAIACFALTLVMCMQFKIVKQTDITTIETMRKEELMKELADWKEKYSDAQQQYKEKTAKLVEYEEKAQSGEESEKLIYEELKETQMHLGETNVQGQGIEITIKDAESEDMLPISSEDLLIIVDYLKLAGAEAISLNGERIINTTDIVDVYNSIIFVNQQRILPQYIIKAIGEPSKLESTLLGNGGYVDTLRKYGFDITIERENRINIPKYNKDISYKYIQ